MKTKNIESKDKTRDLKAKDKHLFTLLDMGVLSRSYFIDKIYGDEKSDKKNMVSFYNKVRGIQEFTEEELDKLRSVVKELGLLILDNVKKSEELKEKNKVDVNKKFIDNLSDYEFDKLIKMRNINK